MPDRSLTPRQFQNYVESVQRLEAATEREHRTRERWRTFVSYSHDDKSHRKAVEAILRSHNIAYTVDAKDIGLGENIADWAFSSIRNCSHYLLILSPRSAVAPWVVAEHSYAKGCDKSTLVYLVDGVAIPPQLAADIATDDLDRLDRYFAQDVINADAVDRFLSEMLHLDLAALSQFRRSSDRQDHWELQDRNEREAAFNDQGNPMRLLDDYRPITETQLWSIEATSSKQWRLEFSRTHSVPGFHDVFYTGLCQALVMEPALVMESGYREQSLVGAKRVKDDGSYTITAATGSVEEALYGHRLYGWPMSADFWTGAHERLLSLLE